MEYVKKYHESKKVFIYGFQYSSLRLTLNSPLIKDDCNGDVCLYISTIVLFHCLIWSQEFLRALHLGTHPLRRNGDDIAGTCKVLFAAMSVSVKSFILCGIQLTCSAIQDTQKMDIIINYITHPPRNSVCVFHL